ncbi:CWF19-like protein 2 homolog [Drosophila pseudoobscura]|uniref:CWF19-like protein 2 homolog n=1 Tax=Drosophila pseudoobscura pseudoobscura TaxID=46245 RepID=A0A6I8UHA6_DROPS|nr:CWF19-like protein 2 homolog [Drosophila pseudoobscura]
MSYIQFESGSDKEKARQQIREARAEMLEQAKERAGLIKKKELQKELRGESNWMLPAVAKKLDKPSSSSTKKAKKKKGKHKSKSKSSKVKKSSKKKSRKVQSSSDSDSDSDSDSSSSSSSSSSSEDQKQRKVRKKKKSKRSHNEDEWVERTPVLDNDTSKDKVEDTPVARDTWMTSDDLLLKTFSRIRKEPTKPNDKLQQIDAYDPAKSGRELNPYWKSNGTGLPGFQKPQDDDDDREAEPHSHSSRQSSSTRGWQKPSSKSHSHSQSPSAARRSRSSSESASSDEDTADKAAALPACLTDEQINELAGKAIKAEIMGNTERAAELNQQLKEARKVRADFLATGNMPPKTSARPKKSKASSSSSEHVLLTKTDQCGNVRPLVQSTSGTATDPNSLYGGRRGQKSRNKKVDTHVDGQRVRYFADDDRYDIKQMFEREKHATAAESNLQYADIVSKHKNPNDDLEDIFADKVRKNISEADVEKRELQSAIREANRLETSLTNCERCFDSPKLEKQLMVSMGKMIYLSLPWHVGLQGGHCILTTLQHISCSTQLDEDGWEELNDFRKALTRMFAAQRKDVIFYEIANKLHRRPHISVHCIPIPDSQGEMAPFYFKKAIEESEQEWCINKQLVSLRNKSLRAVIPKGLPYVWVHFGMDSGFAHVIEDEDRFPANFAQEIIGGMLELNPSTWRKPRKEQQSIVKVKSFAESWKKFDCTEEA